MKLYERCAAQIEQEVTLTSTKMFIYFIRNNATGYKNK